MEQENNRENGDGQEPKTKVQGDAGTEPAKTFTQEDIDRIVAKELKPFKAMKADLEKLQKEKQEKEQAELSELDKLKIELEETRKYKSVATEYEETLSELLEAKKLKVPEDKQSLIPAGLSQVALWKWYEQNEQLLFGAKLSPSSPAGGKPPTGPADTLRAQAEEKVRIMYQHDRRFADESGERFKAAVDRVVAEMKKQS